MTDNLSLATPATFTLFGREPGDAIPIADLDSAVPADDVRAVQGFHDALLAERRESAAAFRAPAAGPGGPRSHSPMAS